VLTGPPATAGRPLPDPIQARTALTEAADGDAVRAARRRGWLASELLEELTTVRCVKGVA
jgi:hypothetical protein